jgi:integral membrane protein (TIGR01906 family)
MTEQGYGLINKIARWLFIACLPPFFISAAIAVTVNLPPLYSYGFERYNITDITGIEKDQLEVAAAGLRGYFNSDEEYISVTVIRNGEPFDLFNEKETIHLKDVKDLFKMDYLIVGIAFVYILGYAVFSLAKKEKLRLAGATARGGGATLGLMLITGIGILAGFDWLFWQFHEIAFTNDFWLLDPSTDFLVMMFPGGFWYDAAALIAILAALGAVITGGAGWLYLRKNREKTREAL